MMTHLISKYSWGNARAASHQCYVLPDVIRMLERIDFRGQAKRVFDIGCGNGSADARLTELGYEVIGIEPSAEGVARAREAFPHLQIHQASCYDDLAARFGQFPVVISLEVIEHVFLPREFCRCVYSLLQNEGSAIISTPYNGYWKNLAISLVGGMDRHYNPLWDYGHIKFFSRRTFRQILSEAGLRDIRFCRVGRIAPLAKSMIAIARKSV
jgi:2-polyprenyl-3-methyl-5-hydroxy-6-metoxy-1,4-benzoquinol methylase